MTRYLLLFLFLLEVAAIWPAPQSYTHGNATVWIEKDVKVTYNGGSVRTSSLLAPSLYDVFRNTKSFLQAYLPSKTNAGRSQLNRGGTSFTELFIVEAAIGRTLETIFTECFVPWKFYPRNQLVEPSVLKEKVIITELAITQTGGNDSVKPLAGAIDESYTFALGADGTAKIAAKSYLGVLHALQTFSQLFYEHTSGHGIYSSLAPVLISDEPRFGHRGLNLDVARNWFPKEDIFRTIDALSWNKFNRLHIHMTDAQSWPMDIPALPELSKMGAYQTGLSYSPQDVEDIQSYATLRGIQPIIEFDMPGHTSSIHYSDPELIAAFDARPYSTYCAEPPCGSLKLNSTKVYSFLDTLFADVLPRVSNYTSYFHTGGDEVNVNSYLLDDTVNSNLTTVLTPLMQKFIDRNHDQVRAAGLTPIVWEEMLLDWNLNLGSDVVVQTWISEDSLSAITAKGHKALFGNYNFWYLDCGKGQWLNFDNGVSFETFYPFKDYCDPFKNWRYVYSYDPTANLDASQKKLVLGGEVHLWSEQTDPVNMDGVLWPRASAAGEVMWSGRQDAQGVNRSQYDAAPRLNEWRERLVKRGITAGPVQMIYCEQGDAEICSA